MDITRSLGNIQAPKMKSAEAPTVSDREQAHKNAYAQIQARYGEKPKEARAVKKALDKDDFMRIMITEMKHQDPTKPMDADKMATQMAQITTVEQMKNVSGSLDKLAEKSNTTDRLAMSMMIGKSVTVDKGRFTHQKGTLSPISFDLPEAADKIKLTILDERGEEVATRDLEPMQAGPNTYNWDGLNVSQMQSKSAIYTVRLDAENKEGAKVKVNPIGKETIVGITFEGGETNFLVGDPKSPQKINFKNITRMEGDAISQAAAQQNKAVEMKQLQEHMTAAPVNKGEIELPESIKEKVKLQTAAAAAATDEPEVKAEGFPNGLSD